MMRSEENKNEKSPLPLQPHPWLVICPSGKTEISFFSLSEDRCYERSIHELGNTTTRAFAQEWLVLEDFNSTDYYLWNLISNDKIQLPPLPYNDDNIMCLLSAPPNDPQCRVLFLIHEITPPTNDDKDNETPPPDDDDNENPDDYTDTNDNENSEDDDDSDDDDNSDDDDDGNDDNIPNDDDDANDDNNPNDDDEIAPATAPALYFCKPGYDEEFHKQDLESIIGDNCFLAWTVFKGDFYVLTWETRILLRLDIDDSSGTISATPMTNKPPYNFFTEYLDMLCFGTYLIQSEDYELLYIHIRLYGREFEDVYKITVFRFDFVNRVWKEMKSIGETAILLGPYSGRTSPYYAGTTCCTRGTNLKKESIYFTKGRYLYNFNLETQSISVSLPCPHISIPNPYSYWLKLIAT